MTRYSVQPRDIFAKYLQKVMIFCLLLKVWVKTLVKSMSGNYSQKLLDHAKKSAADAFKTSSKRVIKKQQKQLVI